jgi:hypothetical protein
MVDVWRWWRHHVPDDREGAAVAGPSYKLMEESMTEVKNRMLGQPEGRIPTELPRDWVAMRMLGKDETIHAVPAGNVALCGCESSTGWQWARGFDVNCPGCCRRIAEEELERDDVVQCLRRYGMPVDRENYVEFNWSGCEIRPWNLEFEEELPELLRDYTQTQWPWPKRKRRRRTSK